MEVSAVMRSQSSVERTLATLGRSTVYLKFSVSFFIILIFILRFPFLYSKGARDFNFGSVLPENDLFSMSFKTMFSLFHILQLNYQMTNFPGSFLNYI